MLHVKHYIVKHWYTIFMSALISCMLQAKAITRKLMWEILDKQNLNMFHVKHSIVKLRLWYLNVSKTLSIYVSMKSGQNLISGKAMIL